MDKLPAVSTTECVTPLTPWMFKIFGAVQKVRRRRMWCGSEAVMCW